MAGIRFLTSLLSCQSLERYHSFTFFLLHTKLSLGTGKKIGFGLVKIRLVMQLLIAFSSPSPRLFKFPMKRNKIPFQVFGITSIQLKSSIERTLRKVEIKELSSLLPLLERIHISPLCLVVDFGHKVCSLFRLNIWPYPLLLILIFPLQVDLATLSPVGRTGLLVESGLKESIYK